MSLPLKNLAALLAILCFVSLLSLSPLTAQPPSRVDLIVVRKAARTMELHSGSRIVKTYQVALGGNPVGPKERRRDGRTPDGLYEIGGRNAASSYHRSLRISYPNSEDRKRASQLGVDPGGDIMIHGLPNGMGMVGKVHLLHDWTNGCVAVTNEEIEELWKLVPDHTKVKIEQ